MTIDELIEKHVGKDKVFQEKFHALTVKEALGTISIEELAELERMDNERDEQSPRELDTDNLSQFAIELLEMVYSAGPTNSTKVLRNIEKALEELKKGTP